MPAGTTPFIVHRTMHSVHTTYTTHSTQYTKIVDLVVGNYLNVIHTFTTLHITTTPGGGGGGAGCEKINKGKI